MRLITKVRHTEITPDIKDYAEQKITHKCAQYLNVEDDAIVCDIELDNQFGAKGGLDKRVDITLALPHEHLPIHIEESDAAFKEAIDKAVDRLDHPLSRYKDTH